MGVLDFIFPKRCVLCKTMGSYLCPNCFAMLSFDSSSMHLIHGKGSMDGLFSAIAYKGVAKKLIYSFKYKPYLTDLREVLGDLFYESLIQQEGFMSALQTKPVFVPIPLHPSRLKNRGYNHAQILADELAKRFNLRQIELLRRIKKTASQYGLNKDERKENILGAFAVLPNIIISKYPNILLVDDIVTTGVTFNETAKVLKKAGAQKVWAISLAKG